MATRYCLFTRKVEGTLTCSPCLWNEVTTSFTTNIREKIEMNRLNHNYPESCVSQRFPRWIVPKVDYIYIYIEHVFDAYFSKEVILNLVLLFVVIAQYQLLRISLKFNVQHLVNSSVTVFIRRIAQTYRFFVLCYSLMRRRNYRFLALCRTMDFINFSFFFTLSLLFQTNTDKYL